MPNEREPKIYELAYLIDGRISEEEAQKIVDSLSKLIDETHNIIMENMPPKLRKLAYPIQKQNDAFWGWIRFLMKPSGIDGLTLRIKTMPQVIRFLVVESERPEMVDHRRIKQRKKIITPEEQTRVEDIDKKLEEILGK